MKKALHVFLGVFFLLSLSGCNALKKLLPRAKLTTLVLGFTDSRFSFDWQKEMNAASLLALYHLMEGLVEVKTAGGKIEILPALAEKWEQKKDGLVWTFTLRSTKWSDGEELRAEHFVNAMRRLLGPETDSPYAELFYMIKNAKEFREGKAKFFSEVGVRAVGPRELEFTLNGPSPFFLEALGHPSAFPIRADHLELFAGRKTKMERIGWIGPFRLILLSKKRIQLFENEKYYKSHGILQKIDFLLDQKKEKLVQLMQEQKVHISFGIESQPPLTTVISVPAPEFSYYYLVLGTAIKPLKDPILRRVVALSINRDELSRSMANVQPLGGVIPPGVEGYESNRGMKYDTEMAALVLKNAKLEKVLPSFTYELYVDRSLGTEGYLVADFVKEQLKKNLSMDVKVVTQPFATDKLDKKVLLKAKPYIILEKMPALSSSASLYLQRFSRAPFMIRASWKNKNFDDFSRKQWLSKAQHLLVEEENPVIPLVSFYSSVLAQPTVRGLEQNFLRIIDLRRVSVERL